jgi:hypothetical protein
MPRTPPWQLGLAVRSARQAVVTCGWHQRRVIAPLLRWMDQYLR